MKLRERLQNARKRVSKFIYRFPFAFFEDVLDFAEEVQNAKQNGFTEEELEVLGEELQRLIGEVKSLRKRQPS